VEDTGSRGYVGISIRGGRGKRPEETQRKKEEEKRIKEIVERRGGREILRSG
jgi:hypothetical protein